MKPNSEEIFDLLFVVVMGLLTVTLIHWLLAPYVFGGAYTLSFPQALVAVIIIRLIVTPGDPRP